MGIKHLVHIAKPMGAHGDSILRHQKRATGPGPSQHRRANRGQTLLPIIAMHIDPRQPIQSLLIVAMIHQFQFFRPQNHHRRIHLIHPLPPPTNSRNHNLLNHFGISGAISSRRLPSTLPALSKDRRGC